MPATDIRWIKQADGSTFRGCDCLVQWWPLVNAIAKRRGLIVQQLDVSQGGYNAGGVAASAGTHDGGGVLDLRQYSDDVIRLLREAGAAAWHRTPAQGFSHHCHMVLVGCPHVSRGAASQVTQYRNGTNGLAGRGRDDGPRVNPIRTWSQGIAYMVALIGAASIKEEDMPLNDTDLAKIRAAFESTVNAVDLANQKRIDKVAADADLGKRVAIANQQRIDRNHAAMMSTLSALGQAIAGVDMADIIAAAERGAEKGARDALAAGIEVSVKAAQ